VLMELDQPNLPGTTDQYPNWRIPLGTSLERIGSDPRVRKISEVLNRQSERGGV
jgi:4-alpha-glucanotransferase